MAPGPGEGGETVPQPADVSKVATGDPAKMAALPQRSGERELERYSGKTNRETVSLRRQKNKVDVQPRSTPSLRGVPVWGTGRELSRRTNRDSSSRPSFPARASHRRVRRKMCQKTGKRPPSHLVLSYRQLSFRGGDGDGEDMGTPLPMPEEPDKVRSHKMVTVSMRQKAWERQRKVNGGPRSCLQTRDGRRCVGGRGEVDEGEGRCEGGQVGRWAGRQAFSIALWGQQGWRHPTHS